MDVLREFRAILKSGTCCGCGACVALDRSCRMKMKDAQDGPVPDLDAEADLPDWALAVCPARGVDYPALYERTLGREPSSWLFGEVVQAYTGYSGRPEIRRIGASGGVLTQVLCYLLETGRVDAVIAARQGVGMPLTARAVICTTQEEIIAAAQSVYIPVSMLDILPHLEPTKKYAITCLPEASSALRALQQQDYPPAKLIKYIVGPYTGTALSPAAIRCYLRSNGVKNTDAVTRLQWRAGEWPGYLQIDLASGKCLKSPKVYYNYLIPFFVTQTSLQSMDFVNEFADIAVGDAWSPRFEAEARKGAGGQSVVAVRTEEMRRIVEEMRTRSLLNLQPIDPLKAGDMHGHMLDFKKRGGYLRNRWRMMTFRRAPNDGYRPAKISCVRILVECVISTLFVVGHWSFSRFIVSLIPERIIGPLFDCLRKTWKSISRPTKRKGLSDFRIIRTSQRRKMMGGE